MRQIDGEVQNGSPLALVVYVLLIFSPAMLQRYKLPQEMAARVTAEKWPGNIDDVFRYLTSQPGVRHDVVGMGGAFRGVSNSIQTARRHPEVKSLVLLSGSTDLGGRQFLRSSKLPVLFSAADDDR